MLDKHSTSASEVRVDGSVAAPTQDTVVAVAATELADPMEIESKPAPAPFTAQPQLSGPLHRHPLLEQPKYMFVDLRTNMGGRYLLRVRDTDTIERIKVKIAARLDIPVRQQQLLYNGVELHDYLTVPECGIMESSTITLIPKLSSGPIRVSGEKKTEDDTVVVDSVAAHLSDPAIQQAVARGEHVSFVTRIGGRYMMVRLNHSKMEQPCQCECGATVDMDECNCMATDKLSASSTDSKGQQASPFSSTESSEGTKMQQENASMRSRIAEIRARLQERSRSTQVSSSSSSTAVAAISTKPAPEAAPVTLTTAQLASAMPLTIIAPTSPSSTLPKSSVDNSFAVDLTPSSPANLKTKSLKRSRCHICPAKLGLVHFPCKCGNTYCCAHRQTAAHNCTFVYKNSAPF